MAVGRLSGDIFGVVFTHALTEKSLRDEYARLYNHFKTPMSICDTAFIADFNVGATIRKNRKTNILMTYNSPYYRINRLRRASRIKA